MNPNSRLTSLEYLRFFAAWNIFLGHYIHFYIQFELPFEQGFFPNLTFPYAGLSVPIFFMMSGAIFVHNYFDLIKEKTVTFGRYFKKRLARLYPLHLLTLLITALLQIYFFDLSGKYFIYEFNDIKHFLLHLFFASHWGFEDGHSYNSVVWSVSHEIILYFLFFLVSFYLVRFVKNKLKLFFGLFLILFTLNNFFNYLILKSITAFFIGSLIYCIVVYLKNMPLKKLPLTIITFLFLILFNNVFKRCGLPFGALGPTTLYILLNIDLMETRFLNKTNNIAVFLGNISYSTYLIHFPVSAVMAIVHIKFFKFDFLSFYPIIIYVFFVFLISFFSYKYFEDPLRKFFSK